MPEITDRRPRWERFVIPAIWLLWLLGMLAIYLKNGW